jgi:hypothetical protein
MEEKVYAMIGSDAGAQERFFDNYRRSEHLQPEKVLLQAILEDALHCYFKYARARDRAGRQAFHEAEQWILGGGNGWIFSFDNVCAHLGLDPQYVRRGVERNKFSPPVRPSRKRRHVVQREAA